MSGLCRWKQRLQQEARRDTAVVVAVAVPPHSKGRGCVAVVVALGDTREATRTSTRTVPTTTFCRKHINKTDHMLSLAFLVSSSLFLCPLVVD